MGSDGGCWGGGFKRKIASGWLAETFYFTELRQMD